jgi:hypothetical protein
LCELLQSFLSEQYKRDVASTTDTLLFPITGKKKCRMNLATCNTVVYRNLFIIDLNYMQSIKQLADNKIDHGCMSCLFSVCIINSRGLQMTPVWVVRALRIHLQDRVYI